MVSGPPLNIPRRNGCGAVLDGKVYAIGGFDGTSILNFVEYNAPAMTIVGIRLKFLIAKPS